VRTYGSVTDGKWQSTVRGDYNGRTPRSANDHGGRTGVPLRLSCRPRKPSCTQAAYEPTVVEWHGAGRWTPPNDLGPMPRWGSRDWLYLGK